MTEPLPKPTMKEFMASMERPNRVARMGCTQEQVAFVAAKIYLDFEAQGRVHLLAW